MPARSARTYHASLLGLALSLGACGGGEGDIDGDVGQRSATVERIAACGRDEDALRIMPMGDSITEARAGYDSYRRVLWQRLNAAGCVVDFVGSKWGVSRGGRDSGSVAPPHADFDLDHEAYWDYTVGDLLPRARGLVAQAQPDIVLIHLGTNDVLDGRAAGPIAQDLGTLIDAIRGGKPDVLVLLAKLIPAAPDPAGIGALNRLIDGVAARQSSALSPVVVVDLASGYALADNDDGIHPGTRGEAKIGDGWARAILAWRDL
jgi:acyl-CoA thioesterase-1